MKQEPLFYIPLPENEQEVAGPYNLVQMAQLLRDNVISAETFTFQEGEEEWKPFGERPQFIIAREMPPDVVSRRVVEQQEAESVPKAPIPLPSTVPVIMIGVAGVLLVIGGALTYFMSAADTGMGICFAVAGLGLGLVGHASIMVQLVEEGWITRLMVLFVPFFDVYYFTANLEKYLPFLCAKYIGSVMALTAFAGIASVDPNMAGEWKSILSMVGMG